MPAERQGTAPIADFTAFAREDAEFVEFHRVLRRLREVESAAPPVQTLRGPRVKAYTAACPVDGRHRLRIEQVDGGAVFTCHECDVSEGRRARLGAALERVTGFARVAHAAAR